MSHREAEAAVLEEANRDSWMRQVTSILQEYAHGVPLLQDEAARFSSLEACAMRRENNAFTLLAAGHEDLARRLSEHAAAVAEEALHIGSFERMFYQTIPRGDDPYDRVDDPTFVPTPLMLKIQETRGKMHCREVIHYAQWFITGERPLDLWQQVVALSHEVFELFDRQYLNQERPNTESTVPLLRKYVEAGDFAGAVRVYRNDYGGALPDPPRSRRYLRNEAHVLYVLAEYLLGRRDLEGLAREGVERAYQFCRHWHRIWVGDRQLRMWDERLGWAYLRGKYLTGVSDLRWLLDGLQGY